MRRLLTFLAVLLTLLLGVFVVLMLRYDLQTTPLAGGDLVYRLDRWSGEVTVMLPEGFEGDVVSLSSLASELHEIREVEVRSRNDEVRARATEVSDNLFETVLNLREILAGYREEAAAALPSEKE